MKDKKSEDYDAMLVAQARLHLSNIVNGHMSEIFFETMSEIVQRNIHYGYRSINGKEIKLSGIKDFFYNFHYGLGIKNLADFLCNCAKIDIEKKSKDGRVRNFIDWLQKEDPEAFEFPDADWELRRLRIAINQMQGPKEKKYQYASMVKRIYSDFPDELKHIGPERKYKTIPSAYSSLIELYHRKSLGPIKLYDCPTVLQVEELARELYDRLDKYKARVLIAKLIEVYKLNDAIEKHIERDTPADDNKEI